jgi:Cu+-exporting ATPase
MEICYHCGDDIIGKGYSIVEKKFCCNGCKMVYQLLHENNMDSFYTLDKKPGVKPSNSSINKYDFLEVDSIQAKFIDFRDENTIKVTLFLPAIHCSSCIYLLENASKIEPAISSCQVNFTKREAVICYDSTKLKLSELALFLDKIGYAPNFGNRNETEKKMDKQFMYKLGVAGFAFGSIMLWSFPEYLGVSDMNEQFRSFTTLLTFIVSLPVLFYSANGYFISAYKAIRYKTLNLDVSITIGIIALYAQSVYTILNGDGPGYMDSFASFIFFLLIGKWFQNKTYKTLSFERDHTSYFPVAVTRMIHSEEEIVEIEDLKENDTIIVRNEEVIPCDSELISEEAKIDYSFVTGESTPILKKKGDFIYAGGKLLGQRSVLKVLKESNRSHLTQLWNDVSKEDKGVGQKTIQDKISLYFLVIILFISIGAAIGWAFLEPSRITSIVVSILIVACPCALALASPFTFGNVLRVLGRKGLYLKNAKVIERMNDVTDVVFDKTGTLTTGILDGIEFIGTPLTDEQKSIIIAVAHSSTHPLSRAIVGHLKLQTSFEIPEITQFEEISGKGISALCNGKLVKIGSEKFVGKEVVDNNSNETSVYISITEVRNELSELMKDELSVPISNQNVSKFIFHSELRSGMAEMIQKLSHLNLHVLSGDNEKDKELLISIFANDTTVFFNQSPSDKLEYIEKLKSKNKKVMMIGDGLNDAGALGKSDVGIAVSEDIFRFTPSSDAIVEASKLHLLPSFLNISLYSKKVLKTCLVFSVSYNIIGLSIAISGHMSPLVAAILMPISSITVVGLSTLLVLFKGGK